MTRKHILWLAPLAAAALTISAASAPGGATPETLQQEALQQEPERHEAAQEQAVQEQAAHQQGDTEPEQFVAQVDEWICAIRKVADFGTYCAYYAIHCPTMGARSWSNTNCNLSAGSCSSPAEPQCAKLPSSTKKEKKDGLKPGHLIDPTLKSKGLPKPKPANFSPTPAMKDIRVIANHLVNLEDGGGQKLRVRLYQILVPKFGKHSQVVFGYGVEVEPAGQASFDIPYDERVVTFSGKHCEVDLQGVVYSIILSTQPQVRRGGDAPPKEDAGDAGDAAAAPRILPAQNISQPCCGSVPVVTPVAPRLFRGRLR